MRKIIFSFAGILLLLLLLNSCRRDELTDKTQQEPTKASKFDIFSKNGKEGSHAAKEGSMHYQEAFRYLYFRYYELHPEEAPDFSDKTKPRVNWLYATEVFYEEDSSKIVFFPVMQDGKVVELLGAGANRDDTYVDFFLHQDDDFKAEAIAQFAAKIGSDCYNDCLETPIQEVVITWPKPKTKKDINFLVHFGIPSGGGCDMFGDCGGGGGGGSSAPVIPPPQQAPQAPCEKMKALLQKADMSAKINDLKTHTGPNEKGWKFMKDGTPPQETTQSGTYQTNFGDPSLIFGGYHWHPSIGMFSPQDIKTLIEIARYQAVNSTNLASDGYMGLIAPNGIHYVIHFNGTQSQLPPIPFAQQQVDEWNGLGLSLSINYSQNFIEYQQSFGILNNKGREALFFDTIKMMGLENKVTLQEIDQNGNVSTIKQNTDGSTTSVPCP